MPKELFCYDCKRPANTECVEQKHRMNTEEVECMGEKKEQERKSQQFWAVDDCWGVVLVTGYECPPNDDVWWVPELGYSLSTKHHLFVTAAEARAHAEDKLETKIADLQRALQSLRAEALAEKEI